MDEFSLDATILKVDSSQGLVMGWAVECLQDGEQIFDRQGDHVPEDAMLAAAADFMANRRVAKDMHTGEPQGTVVFAWPMTTDVAKAFGIQTQKTGLMVAMKPEPGLLAKFQSGELTGFSIGGKRIHDEAVVEKADFIKNPIPQYGEPIGDWHSYKDSLKFGTVGKVQAVALTDFVTNQPLLSAGRLAHVKSRTGEGAGHDWFDVPTGVLTPEGKVFILDGNHRVAAAMAHAHDVIQARVVDPDEEDPSTELPETQKYAENQARDDRGRFGAGGANQADVHRMKSEHDQNAKRIAEIKGSKQASRMQHESRRLESRNAELRGLMARASSNRVGYEKYSSDQARDERGKFGSGGGVSGNPGKASMREQKLFTQAHENLRGLRNQMGREKDPKRFQAQAARAHNIQSYIRHQLDTRPGIEGHFVAQEQAAGRMHKSLGDKQEGMKTSDMLDLAAVGQKNKKRKTPPSSIDAQEADRKAGKVKS